MMNRKGFNDSEHPGAQDDSSMNFEEKHQQTHEELLLQQDDSNLALQFEMEDGEFGAEKAVNKTTTLQNDMKMLDQLQ